MFFRGSQRQWGVFFHLVRQYRHLSIPKTLLLPPYLQPWQPKSRVRPYLMSTILGLISCFCKSIFLVSHAYPEVSVYDVPGHLACLLYLNQCLLVEYNTQIRTFRPIANLFFAFRWGRGVVWEVSVLGKIRVGTSD